MKSIKINPETIPFNYKVREMCKSCKRYGFKATCPPHIDSIEYYADLFEGYKNGIIYYDTFECADLKDWKAVGRKSSLAIHKVLLKERERLFAEGHYFVALFGAGSCKACVKECSFPCRQPQKAIIPLEGTGVNVVKLMKQYNVDVSFPVKNSIYRIGLVLYD